MRITRRSARLVAALSAVVSVATIGCAPDPEREGARFLSRAEAHAAAGRLPDAVIEYRNALQHLPRRAQIHDALARAYDALGDSRRADESFMRAAELDSRNLNAMVRACAVLLAAGRARDAELLAARTLREHPDDLTVLVMHARAALASGHTADAERDVRAALASDPRSAAAHLVAAALHVRKGDVAAARREMETAVVHDPGSQDAWLALGELLSSQGDAEAAEKAMLAALKIGEPSAAVRRRVAAFYLRAGRAAEAEAHLLALSEASPGDRLRLADYYVAGDRAAEAERTLGPLLDDETWSAAAHLRRAMLRARAGRRADALADLERSLADPAIEPDARLLTSELLLSDRRYAEALDHAQRAASLRPRDARAIYLIGLIDLAEGRLDAAARHFKTARDLGEPIAADVQLTKIAATKGDFTSAVAAARQVAQRAPSPAASALLAQALRLEGDLDAAAGEIERARRQWPDAASLDVELGMLKESMKDMAGARAAYTRALKRDPRQPVAANNLAWLLSRQGRLDEALQRALQAQAEWPSVPQVLHTVGWMYHLAGQPDAAIAALTAARDAVPGNPLYHYHLGMAYAGQGRRDDASAELERALAISPTFAGADEGRRTLDSLR